MDNQEKQIENEQVEEEISSVDTEQVEEKQTGAIIGVIIIVILLVVGGLYYIKSRTSVKQVSDETAPTPAEILKNTEATVKNIENQSSSDKIDDIQKDLNKTDLKNIDVDLGKINAELGI